MFYLLKLAVGALMAFTVFPVRQFARNWMAVKLGDDTPVREGKLTLNPLAHTDPIGLLAMILIGFGWGRSASINPNNFKCRNKKLGMTAVSLAGPVANLLFALVTMVIIVLGPRFGMSSTFVTVFEYIMLLNVRLAVFLLLPVPGFDGGDILMMFLPPEFVWRIIGYMQIIQLAVLLLLFVGPLGSLVDFISGWIINLMYMLVTLVSGGAGTGTLMQCIASAAGIF